MRYRKLDANGDYIFGRPGEFFIDAPGGVAQAIVTRLKLMTNEWFLDSAEGTPYATQILGAHTQATRDVAIKSRILGTPGVRTLLEYGSNVNAQRKMTVTARVDTIYGAASLSGTF